VVVILLCQLFNGHIPASVAASYTVPIRKISPVISKLFELAILERFSSLFETSDTQFGFKRNLSCSHARFFCYVLRILITCFVRYFSTTHVVTTGVLREHGADRGAQWRN